MTRRVLIVTVILAMASGFSLFFACRGDKKSNDLSDSNATPPPGACDQNAIPELTDVKIDVDGELLGSGASFMEGVTYNLYLAYRDADCNIGGGEVYFRLDGGEQTTRAGAIPAEVPCSASAEDQAFAIPFGPSGDGDHHLLVYIADQCAAESAKFTFNFTLTPYVADDDTAADDDTTADDDTAVDDDTVGPTLLNGTISYAGSLNLQGRKVALQLWTDWLPTGIPVAWTGIAIPTEGLPFPYEWNLDEAGVAEGEYFLSAFADAVDGDGFFNPDNDPVYSPFRSISIVVGQTATANVWLVGP